MNSPVSSRTQPAALPIQPAHRDAAEPGRFNGQAVRPARSIMALAGRVALGVLTLGLSELSYAVYKTCTRAPVDDARPLGLARQVLQAQADPQLQAAAPAPAATVPSQHAGAQIAAAKLDLIETWHSARKADADTDERAPGEIAKGVRYPMGQTTTRDINRGLLWLEGKALRFQMSGSELKRAHESRSTEDIHGGNASALNLFIASLADEPEAATHLAIHLSRFIHQGAVGTQAGELSNRDYGASRIFRSADSPYTFEFRITLSEDGASLRINQRFDYHSLLLYDPATDENQVHDEIYKSEVTYDVPLANLKRADFDPNCVQVQSARWGFATGTTDARTERFQGWRPLQVAGGQGR